jgi:hypothetical protein
MRVRPGLLRSVLLLLAAAYAIAASGCAQNTDASDPDPHYYKGKQFTHKRME